MKMISVLIVLAVFINLSKPVVLKLFMAYPTSEAKKKPPQSLTNNKRGGKKVGFYLYKVHIISATASNVFLHPTKGKKNISFIRIFHPVVNATQFENHSSKLAC